MRDEQLYQQFVSFVKEQESEREINHNSWITCAVGDFWISLGELWEWSDDYANSIPARILGYESDLYYTLGSGGRVYRNRIPDGLAPLIETYGQLRDYMESLEQ